MSPELKRSARLSVDKARSRVEVTVGEKTTGRDVAAINEVLINKVIKGLTGCPCMSGVIEVVWKPEFQDVIKVDLPGQ